MNEHNKKLEKKKKKIYKRFKRHPLSKEWDIQLWVASNKLKVKITRINKHGYPRSKKVTLGLKNNLNLDTFLK